MWATRGAERAGQAKAPRPPAGPRSWKRLRWPLGAPARRHVISKHGPLVRRARKQTGPVAFGSLAVAGVSFKPAGLALRRSTPAQRSRGQERSARRARGAAPFGVGPRAYVANACSGWLNAARLGAAVETRVFKCSGARANDLGERRNAGPTARQLIHTVGERSWRRVFQGTFCLLLPSPRRV